MIDAAIERAMEIYAMLPRPADDSVELRAQLAGYLTTLHDAGETDLRRLMLFGLIYLREIDGHSDPLKAGFTGL